MSLHLEEGRLYCWAGYEEFRQASMRGREGAKGYVNSFKDRFQFTFLNFQGDLSCLWIEEYNLSLVTWLVNNNKDQSYAMLTSFQKELNKGHETLHPDPRGDLDLCPLISHSIGRTCNMYTLNMNTISPCLYLETMCCFNFITVKISIMFYCSHVPSFALEDFSEPSIYWVSFKNFRVSRYVFILYNSP